MNERPKNSRLVTKRRIWGFGGTHTIKKFVNNTPSISWRIGLISKSILIQANLHAQCVEDTIDAKHLSVMIYVGLPFVEIYIFWDDEVGSCIYWIEGYVRNWYINAEAGRYLLTLSGGSMEAEVASPGKAWGSLPARPGQARPATAAVNGHMSMSTVATIVNLKRGESSTCHFVPLPWDVAISLKPSKDWRSSSTMLLGRGALQ